MKNITHILIVALGLFLVACSPSPEYNFSSLKDLEASIMVQAEKEGLSKAKVTEAMTSYVKEAVQATMTPEAMKAMESKAKEAKMPKEMLMLKEINEISLAKLKEKIEGKTLKKAFNLN